MGEIMGRDGTVHGGMGTDLCRRHVALVTGTYRGTSAGKVLFSWYQAKLAWGWGKQRAPSCARAG